MPKRVPTFTERLGREVFELFEEKQEFSLPAYKSAFANVAHRHSIWHHKDRAEYNRFFEWVMKEVKLLIKKHNRPVVRRVNAPAKQKNLNGKIRVPTLMPINPNELKHNLDLDF